MMVFGVMGYVFQKLGYPLPPLVLAIVLGDKAEESFRQAMLGSQGRLTIFWSNWLVGTIMTLGMILLLWPLITWLLDKTRSKPGSKPGDMAAVSAGAAANPDHRA
jgi:putative tricarboxylic transport membrane protein